MSVNARQLQRSKQIQRRTGRTFHLATRLLPKRTRHATYVLYAFFRVADEVVDDPNPLPPDQQEARLEYLREVAIGNRETDDPVVSAFATVRQQHDIDTVDVHAFIDAMKRDIVEIDGEPHLVAFGNQHDLERYLRGSAVAVAYMMLAVMAPTRPAEARPHAKALGEAFQLTNFLRDVREDLEEYGRIYLPETTLNRYDVDLDALVAKNATPGFRAAMHREMTRAESKYRAGVAGIRYLPHDCQFPVLLAAVFYAEYHRLIRAQRFDVLSNRPRLTTRRYLTLFVLTGWHWLRTREPETVFYRVSPVERVRSRSPPQGQERQAGQIGDRIRKSQPFEWLQ